MCLHVLCLSLSTPPPSLLSPNKWPFFLSLSLPSFLSFRIFFLVSASSSLSWIPRNSFPSYIVLPFLSEFNSHPENLLSSSMKARMCSSSALLKQEFFKKWIKGLQIYSSLKKEMTISERKRAIKFSSDVAIASTGGAAAQWRKALAADVETAAAADDGAARTVVEHMLGRELVLARKAPTTMACSKKIVRRSHLPRRRNAAARVVPSSSSIAKKMVRNRTRTLKRVVPGGEKLDEISLIKETLDYIASLQIQVDVMRNLAAAAETLDHHQQKNI